MNTAFNLFEFDDGPTLVMAREATVVMDRRQLPPVSSVPSFPPPSLSPESTQPARRVRGELAGTRRLAVVLAIGFAFVGGLAAAFGAQVLAAQSSPPPVIVAARAPRTLTDRTSSLDTRSAPDVRPHAADEAAPPRAASTERSRPYPPAEPGAPSASAPAPAESEDLAGRDLLGEGLRID